jgi:Fe-S-cluster containining protein
MSAETAHLLVRAAVAAADPERLKAGVEAVYRYADAAIAAFRPACHQCARCCQFQRHGHRLFVSTAEAAFFLRSTSVSRIHEPIGGTCPFLREAPGRCAARNARPLGCRLYYCHSSSQWLIPDLYGRLHRRLQVLHEVLGVPYYYAEWLAILRAATALRVP